MIGFTVLAVQVILWQNQDLSVDIISETETGNQEVTISIKNTAGSTLLFYENAEMSGKIEYLSENGWVEYCDFSYTTGNVNAVSQLYGGTFAELDPGEDWDLTIPEDKVANMKNGTYRIKMTYITEKNYNKYLENAYRNRDKESSSDVSSEIVPEKKPSGDKSGAIADISESDSAFGNDVEIESLAADSEGEINEDVKSEKFLAESSCEVFVKTFDIVVPEDLGQEISIASRSVRNGDAVIAEKNDSLVSEPK